MHKKTSLPPASGSHTKPELARMLKTTVLLTAQQLRFMDHLSIKIRHDTDLSVKRTALIRIFIAALADSQFDLLPHARSQQVLYEALRDQLRRGRS